MCNCKDMELNMVTSNIHKFVETREFAKEIGIKLIQKNIDIHEVRGTLEDIVMAKAKKAYEGVQTPIVCDDSGFFIDSLNDFPGEFSRFVFEKIGNEGILKLIEDKEDKGAEFRCMACYFDGSNFMLSLGIVRGKITDAIRGKFGFGYDPIFIPDGFTKTFSEDFEIKMKNSHRKKAFTGLFKKILEKKETK